MAKKDKETKPAKRKTTSPKLGGQCTRNSWCSMPNGHRGACLTV